ncbi:CocE/NonD family hydrolase [Nocardia sp. NPDC127526]|uniref:CocE/NonD family hydrolase n=1 Tax=Nocardia sp. NPDC127526 TaxID=3345393 RepID=UPI003627EF3E
MTSAARTRWWARCAVVVTAAVCALQLAPVGGGEPPEGFTGIDGGAAATAWTATVDGPQPYSDMFPDLAVPITMSDGTVLKADIIHPGNGGKRTDEKLPTVLQIQGYSKIALNVAAALLEIPGVDTVLLPWIASFNFPGSGLDGLTDLTRQLDSGVLQASAHNLDLVRGGYHLVQLDLRGTGTSEGLWQVFGERERQDAEEVIDWIAAQPWSNGAVGAMGTSFTGITALQAAERGHPALQAVFANVPSGDLIDDIVAPGGGVGFGFLPFWLLAVNLSKMTPDVEALLAGRWDTAQQLRWLRDRLADPMTMMDVVLNAYGATTVDQLSERTRAIIDPDSPFRTGLKTAVENVTAPTFIIEAWFDIFGSTATETYNNIPLPMEQKKLIMGDGYHVGAGVAGFGHPGMPPRLDVLQRAWFDKWLKGIDNGIDKYSPLTVKQQGGQWTSMPSFPRADQTHQRMYFSDRHSGTAASVYDGMLSARPLQEGVRDLTIAPNLLSLCSRDTARIWAGVPAIVVACGEDSRIWENAGLTFTSNPVTEATTISGPIAVHLNAVHDTRDGYWVVTVNDVAPEGQSREISTGQLVASLRAVDEAGSTRSASGDYTKPELYLDLDRRQLTEPGVPVTLDLALTPIDAVLQPGHRLRVDVFASNFPRGLPPTPVLVDSQLAPQHLRLDPDAPSWVNIPLSVAIPE